MARDFGDFQTPPELVSEVLKVLQPVGTRWPRVLEPTCGRGNFITGLLNLPDPPKEIIGLEVQDEHIMHARQAVAKAVSTTVAIEKADILGENPLGSLRWKTTGPLLVVGNPPWITLAELGSLTSGNVPRKSNIRGFRGIEAITGTSNFDLTEYVWIKLLTELVEQRPAIALLCKTSVARKILRFCHEQSIPVQETAIRKIDARKWFEAAVDACLFFLRVGSREGSSETPVYPDLFASEPESLVGIAKGTIVADITAFRQSEAVDGTCPLVWRQGIKHDAASVMVLHEVEGILKNKTGETVEVEDDYLFPLVKGSDLAGNGRCTPRLFVIVTQRRLGEPTEPLKELAPKLWRYLKKHERVFAARKSSVYAKGPEFSMFGVGDYSFSPYKVAVAGMYGAPRFRALGPTREKPVMLDDTCYFLSCESAKKAAVVSSLLNDPRCLCFLNSLLFKDSKRPITKGMLQRIDLKALLLMTEQSSLQARAEVEFERLSGRSRLPKEVLRDVFP